MTAAADTTSPDAEPDPGSDSDTIDPEPYNSEPYSDEIYTPDLTYTPDHSDEAFLPPDHQDHEPLLEGNGEVARASEQ